MTAGCNCTHVGKCTECQAKDVAVHEFIGAGEGANVCEACLAHALDHVRRPPGTPGSVRDRSSEVAVAPTARRPTTFAMIKPDAVAGGHVGDIITMIERGYFDIRGIHMTSLDAEEAKWLYGAHVERPFFPALVEFTCSGPVVALALASRLAVDVPVAERWRLLMGATDSSKAMDGTIRHRFGSREIVMRNAVHGSDGPEAAARELGYFFPDLGAT